MSYRQKKRALARELKKKRRRLMNKILIYLLLFIIATFIFVPVHNYANTLRPKPGYGGELTAFLLPFIVWAVKENIKLSLKKGNGET